VNWCPTVNKDNQIGTVMHAYYAGSSALNALSDA